VHPDLYRVMLGDCVAGIRTTLPAAETEAVGGAGQ
jgi:hypothetical protein